MIPIKMLLTADCRYMRYIIAPTPQAMRGLGVGFLYLITPQSAVLKIKKQNYRNIRTLQNEVRKVGYKNDDGSFKPPIIPFLYLCPAIAKIFTQSL